MKRIMTVIMALIVFKCSMTGVFAEVKATDYGFNKIDMGNRVIVGVTEGLIVYSEDKKSDRPGMPSKATRFYGMQDISGKLDTGAVFNKIDPFSEGLAAVYQYDEWGNLKVGFVNQYCKLRIQVKYTSAEQTPEEGYRVTVSDKAPSFSNGRALVKFNDQFMYININGGVAIKLNCDDASKFSDGMAMVGFNIKSTFGTKTLFGYIDLNGKQIIKPQFEIANSFKSHVAMVRKTGFDMNNPPMSVINKKGKVLFEIPIDQLMFIRYEFSEGLLPLCNASSKYGYINTQGKMATPFIYAKADAFKGGLAKVPMVKNGMKTIGYINAKGAVAINAMAYTVSAGDDFADGYIKISNDGMRYGIMDSKGNVIIEPVFNEIYYYDNGLCIATVGELFSLSPDVVYFMKKN